MQLSGLGHRLWLLSLCHHLISPSYLKTMKTNSVISNKVKGEKTSVDFKTYARSYFEAILFFEPQRFGLNLRCLYWPYIKAEPIIVIGDHKLSALRLSVWLVDN